MRETQNLSPCVENSTDTKKSPKNLETNQTNLLLLELIFAGEKNKPAAQAAGADPSRCNSTNRQKLPFQQNSHYS